MAGASRRAWLAGIVTVTTASAQAHAQLPDSVVVHVVAAEDQDLTLYTDDPEIVESSSSMGNAFAPPAPPLHALCEAPCKMRLPRVRGTFFVSYRDRPPQPAPAIEISGPGVLELDYQFRKPTRALGWTIAGVGTGLGALLILSGWAAPALRERELSTSERIRFFGGGVVSIGVGLGLGLLLATRFDVATVRFTPASGEP